jgi:hypothetical protein
MKEKSGANQKRNEQSFDAQTEKDLFTLSFYPHHTPQNYLFRHQAVSLVKIIPRDEKKRSFLGDHPVDDQPLSCWRDKGHDIAEPHGSAV